MTIIKATRKKFSCIPNGKMYEKISNKEFNTVYPHKIITHESNAVGKYLSIFVKWTNKWPENIIKTTKQKK
jgi:hypothetical protein